MFILDIAKVPPWKIENQTLKSLLNQYSSLFQVQDCWTEFEPATTKSQGNQFIAMFVKPESYRVPFDIVWSWFVKLASQMLSQKFWCLVSAASARVGTSLAQRIICWIKVEIFLRSGIWPGSSFGRFEFGPFVISPRLQLSPKLGSSKSSSSSLLSSLSSSLLSSSLSSLLPSSCLLEITSKTVCSFQQTMI